jgi:ribonuclease HII
LIIDGNRFVDYPNIPHTTIVKGDGKYASIAAASVLAKTYRDQHMSELHLAYPQYNWIQNQGYPTAAHRSAIAIHGISPLHRKTFIHIPLPIN